MEGVGARLGRSSTRYGPATVFSGPVRKWKKKWVPLPNPNATNSAAAAAAANGGNGSSNHSHLLLYKWTPVSSQPDGAAAPATASKDSSPAAATPATPAPEEPPRRKFRYVPVSVIEEQKQEAAAKSDDENKPNDADHSPQPTQADGPEGKPDINDVAIEETQVSDKDHAPNEDVKETNLDLSLNLNAHDGDLENDSELVEKGESGDRLERVSSGEDVEMKPATNLEAGNRMKRKAVTPDLEMRV